MGREVAAVLIAVVATIVAMPQAASAHIRLDPAQAVVGRQTYSLRVPTEKDIPTVSVRLEVPKNVGITGILPMAGWQYTTKTEPVTPPVAETGHGASDTRVTEITWSGGQIKTGEYMLFGFAAHYTGSPGRVSWKAYQTYADGSVVAWDDSSDEAPAPSVEITESSKLDDLTNQVAALQKQPAASDNNELTLWIAVAAALASIAALLISFKRHSYKGNRL